MRLQRVVEFTLMHMEPFSVFTKITLTTGRWECESSVRSKRETGTWHCGKEVTTLNNYRPVVVIQLKLTVAARLEPEGHVYPNSSLLCA